jgi:hypothetical protein
MIKMDKKCIFKVGDKVIKARRYSVTQYCKYSGDASEVPIGTVGKIKFVDNSRIRVKFETGISWNVDQSELDLIIEEGGTMELKAGARVTCTIEGKEIRDAKLQYEKGEWYICQNEREGNSCEDKLGYKYSWVFDEDNPAEQGVVSLSLLNPIKKGDDIEGERLLKSGLDIITDKEGIMFKAGDVVERINDDCLDIKVGDIATVASIEGNLLFLKGSKNYVGGYTTRNFKLYKPATQPKGVTKMGDMIKKYWVEHQDVLMTVGIVMLVDHFLFGGALREKIKTTLENFLTKADKKISAA